MFIAHWFNRYLTPNAKEWTTCQPELHGHMLKVPDDVDPEDNIVTIACQCGEVRAVLRAMPFGEDGYSFEFLHPDGQPFHLAKFAFVQ